MSLFNEAVNAQMLRLAELPNVRFYGQSVRYDGAAIFDSMKGVPMDLRVEMPVVEDFQLGFCIGAALAGVLPVCIFPRMDFMLLCVNQLVNHLDKLPQFGWKPKLIIRTTVGKKTPLDAGPQHTQNHVWAFKQMLSTVHISEVRHVDDVESAYTRAIYAGFPSLIVENPS